MLQFTCCFDVKRDILDYVKIQRSDATKCAFPESSIHVKVVGQERDMQVIYVWDDVSPLSPVSPLSSLEMPVTHVGIYSPSTQTHLTLFVHDKLLNIVSCSVNQDHSVLAYVALVKYNVDKHPLSPVKASLTELYSAYLAEIKPQNRIFDLNIQRRNQLLVQFLWSKQNRDSSNNKECKLIFFLHKESIALYSIPLGRVDSLGVVISSQPTISEIIKHFYWSQWDVSSQRLFFVCRKYSKSADVQPYPVLKCLEYHDRYSNFVKMFDIKLDLPIPLEDSKKEYMDNSSCRTLSEKHFNMEIIQQSGGSLCICYQHPISKKNPSRLPRSQSVCSTSRHDVDNVDQSHAAVPIGAAPELDVVDMNYSVLVVHHGLIINCKIPNSNRIIAESTRLYFSSLDGYILVYAPGHLLHLVNVSAVINPCLHIAVYGDKVPSTPIIDQQMTTTSENLSHFVRERTASLNGDCVYNNHIGKAYKISICKEGLVQTFLEQSRLTQRLAIIHLITIHMKDPTLTKRIMKVLCDDVVSPYIPHILAEYLVGSTFNAARRSMNKEALKHLPFTSTEVMRGQIEQNGGRHITAVFSYVKCSAVFDAFFYKGDKRDRRLSQSGMGISLWDSIHHSVQLLQQQGRQKQQLRFDTSPLKALLMYAEYNQTPEFERSTSSVYCSPGSGSPSLMQKVKLSAKKALSPTKKSESKHPSIFYDLESSVTDLDLTASRLHQLTVEKLSHHLEQHLSPYNRRVHIRSLVDEYIDCQAKQARLLMKLLWSSVGFEGQEQIPTNVPLNVKASEKDHQLYHLCERYYLAVESVCFPIPPGFATFFTCLGYRCLSYQSFLQYIDRGVLQLTADFIRKFFADLPDDEINSARKHELLIKLPESKALEMMEDWKHPIALRYLAQMYVEETLKVDCCMEYPYYLNRETAIEHESPHTYVNTRSNDSDEQEGIAVAFPPLGTLVQLLHVKDPQIIIVNSTEDEEPSCFNMEPKKVEQVALLHTMEQYGNNLSDVTF